ncbi:1-deoxy-D-xylulose-5-phosphate synthase N-terminal domain-containing protein [Streptomyces sp. DT24]|uniref:1-deoxy-D-xylulose-5-phosphate synthase N-terminal domain-containing protein n=1 Tax=Streptomyces sp. DT24 TaxID=3416520 RepID=UPI003CF89DE5
MTILEHIRGPHDLKELSEAELGELTEDIRTFLVQEVAGTGGHLGPDLGVVELSVALHRAFDSPADRILWDTGHQSYVHKLLTGRQDFSKLRRRGGLFGYPSREESEHDVIENSHASTVLGWADGLAKANEVLKRDDHVVAVIGDGALTGGMAWEALNNIAAAGDRPLIIVVNDNGRSYAPTIGGLANHLATPRTTDGYERFLSRAKGVLQQTPVVGQPLYGSLHGAKKGLKDAFAPQGMFEDLGLKYVGPVDGHDIAAVESALHRAKRFHGPVLVHCLTEKGRGHRPALEDEADRFHTVGAMDPRTCAPLAPPPAASWTSVFGSEIAAPRDADRLRAELREAVGVDDAPTVIRFPEESVGEPVPAVDRIGGMDVLHRAPDPDVLLVAVGVLAPVCPGAAELLAERGIRCTVVDPRWVKPVDEQLAPLAARHRLVTVAEDNSRSGGVGRAIAQALRDAGVDVPLRTLGIPEQFIGHAKRTEILADTGLTPVEIAGRIGEALAAGRSTGRSTGRDGSAAVNTGKESGE